MLEPAIVDYAQSSPVMSSDVRTNESLSANYRAISENNNVLSVNNVQPEYANTISSAVQQIEPTVYQQHVEQQLVQQQQLSGLVRTLSMDSGLSRGGFINVLVLTGIIGFVCGFIVWITLTIMGN